MTVPATTNPLFNVARAAGFAYLGVILLGAFAEFFVRINLRVPGDTSQTIANIRDAELLFRMALASDLVMLLVDVALALFLFILFRDVHRNLALFALFLNLLRGPVLAANLSNHYSVVQILTSVGAASAFTPDQIETMAILALEQHQIGYAMAEILFGSWCFVTGVLIYRSGFVPKFIGILMMLASVGYLVDLGVAILAPDASRTIPNLLVSESALAEITVGLWLLVMGGRVHAGYRQRLQAPA